MSCILIHALYAENQFIQFKKVESFRAMKNKLLLTLFLALSYGAAWAQPLNQPTYDTKIKLAEEAVATQDYFNALEQYKAAHEESEDKALLPLMAEMNLKIRDYRAAERNYRSLLRNDKENKYIEHRFNYARVLKMQGKYADAMEEFTAYIEKGADEDKKKMAQLELAGAELGVAGGGAQGVAVERIKSRDVNGPASQYTPVLNNTGRILYFASLEKSEVNDSGDKPEDFVRIFRSSIDEEGKYAKPEVLGPEINRPEYHNVGLSISPDGNRMFFTRVKLTGNAPSESKIYMSEGGDGNWKSANEVQGVNGEFLAAYPTVGELYGKEVLFFTSDMEGGQGGMDIYYATHQGDGVYGEPKNLGPSINTAADEKSPFWFDGTLYFSSEGYPSLGGQDIFYAVWNGSNWSAPENMGPAYNTAADEISFRLYDEGYKGFFGSNRPEGRSVHAKTCCDDLYTFEIARQYVDLVVGAFDAERKPLKGVTVQLLDETAIEASEKTQSQTQANGNRFDFPLNFDRAYTVVASHPGYYPDTLTFNTNGVTESKSYEERFFLKPIEPEIRDVFIDEPIVMENIVYDFDSHVITAQAEIDLQKIYEWMTEHADMEIELGSHTDSHGKDSYNANLSQRRAESARQWLVQQGIDKKRIAVKGYGESQPKTVSESLAAKLPFLKEGDVLTEDFINGLATQEQKDQADEQNRRTEFTITAGPTSIRVKVGTEEVMPEQKKN